MLKIRQCLFHIAVALSPILAFAEPVDSSAAPARAAAPEMAQPRREEPPAVEIADPLQPVNRAVFAFNDRFQRWLLEPAARGYARVVPEPGRRGLANMFRHLNTPTRLANCLLQGEPKQAVVEVERFIVNSVFGVLGFGDPAADRGLVSSPRDFGQTLGVYGLPPTFAITWPLLGASNLRDSLGIVGDSFLDPWRYARFGGGVQGGARGTRIVNDTSLRLGLYERIKQAADDPYIEFRNQYERRRQGMFETGRGGRAPQPE